MNLNGDESTMFSNKRRYQSLVGKLIYLTMEYLNNIKIPKQYFLVFVKD